MFQNWREIKNKGMNKQQQPDSGIHYTSTHYPTLGRRKQGSKMDMMMMMMSTCVPSFNLLGLAVPDISVMKNFNV